MIKIKPKWRETLTDTAKMFADTQKTPADTVEMPRDLPETPADTVKMPADIVKTSPDTVKMPAGIVKTRSDKSERTIYICSKQPKNKFSGCKTGNTFYILIFC